MGNITLVLIFTILAAPALASDGVLEINQACAVNTGCFTGDTAGLPVTISASGSYRLTSNLAVPDVNTDGILLSTDNVSIDLAGFEISGPVVCSGTPLACTPNAGTGSGVEVTLATLSGIAVRNGSIRGMGNYGVSLGLQAEVTSMRVRSNRLSGILTSPDSTVSGNTAYQNGEIGIYASPGTTVLSNTAYQNALQGIVSGIGSTVSGNTAYQNGGDGIFVGDGSTVSDNAAFGNGDGASPNDDDGIQCLRGCIVRGNTVRSNSGYGLNLNTDSAYSDNVVTANTTGTVTGAGSANGRGGNYCSGTGTVSVNCP